MDDEVDDDPNSDSESDGGSGSAVVTESMGAVDGGGDEAVGAGEGGW